MLRFKKNNIEENKVAVIGAGWYGCHISIELSKQGYHVTLYEKNAEIFSGISGMFGIRIHAGPHYPRSLSTRRSCRNGFNEFLLTYKELVNDHAYSSYALGKKDADGKPSKVNEKTFRGVCEEFRIKGEIDIDKSEYNPQEILAAFDIEEPSAILGERLRKAFEKYLKVHNVIVKYNSSVKELKKTENKTFILSELEHAEPEGFHHVINTTSYQSLLPIDKPLPFNLEIFYQPCLALVYNSLFPSTKPISFIVMDGWYPCFMPYDDRPEKTHSPITKYIMTHGKFTILASYSSPEEAHTVMSQLTDDFVKEKIQQPCETEMRRFWPDFHNKYEYIGWKCAVLAKIKTEKEFRGAVVFQETKTRTICVFPGKITNIFDSAREVISLVKKQDIAIANEGYNYIERGVLDDAQKELLEPIRTDDHNTCALQTFREVLDKKVQGQEKEIYRGEKEKQAFLPKRRKEPMQKIMEITLCLSLLAAYSSIIRKSFKEENVILFFAMAVISGLIGFKLATHQNMNSFGIFKPFFPNKLRTSNEFIAYKMQHSI